MAFDIYASGWVLDQFASVLEHGWQIYTQNMWSFLDVIFSFTYAIYIIVRLCGMTTSKFELSQLALDILATGAPVLVPRLLEMLKWHKAEYRGMAFGPMSSVRETDKA